MGCCFNRKVLAVLAVVALGVLGAAPGAFSRALPLLVAAICPLSMLLMVRAMAGGKQNRPVGGFDRSAERARNPEAQAASRRGEVERLPRERTDAGDPREEPDRLSA